VIFFKLCLFICTICAQNALIYTGYVGLLNIYIYIYILGRALAVRLEKEIGAGPTA
jgi:hypothetical protein